MQDQPALRPAAQPAWQYDTQLYPDPLAFEAFVYLIEHTASGRRYIGSKVLVNRRRIRPQKGNPRRRLFEKRESAWRGYWSSCKPLLGEIALQGHQAFRREILAFYPSRREAEYYEAQLQFELDVLNARLPNGTYAFWNANIARRWFRDRR